MTRIKDTLKEICSKQIDGDYYPILEKIYEHIIDFRNQPRENRAQSIRLLLNSLLKEEDN